MSSNQTLVVRCAGRQVELSVVQVVNDDATAEAESEATADYYGCIASINCMRERRRPSPGIR
jgi:hypothetical protein